MSGMVVDDGKNFCLIKTLQAVDLYLGLMTTADIDSDHTSDTDLQLGSGLTEVSGTGYARITIDKDSWSITDDEATYTTQTFTVGAGGWSNVRGYFLAQTVDGNDVIMAESFPENVQGNKSASHQIQVDLKINCKTQGE